MPQFDVSTFPSTIFWLIVCFSAVLLIFSKIILPRYNTAMELRAHKIRFDLEQASALNEKAQVLLTECEDKIAQAKREIDDIFLKKREALVMQATKEMNQLKDVLVQERHQLDEKYARHHIEMEERMQGEIEVMAHHILTTLGYEDITNKSGSSSAHINQAGDNND